MSHVSSVQVLLALIALVPHGRRSGSDINRCRSAVSRITLLLSPLLLCGAELLGMRTVPYIRLGIALADFLEAIG